VLRGARIAQIDSQAEFKLSAPVDQFYLPRVSVGQAAVLADDGRSALRVNKIYPQVRDGEFRIDLVYSELPPRGLARGQTLNIRLQLGESRSALLLDAGAFLQDSGGAYAFVLDSQGRQAERRPIKLGRRNLQAVEVSDGLRAGERVVTSSYAAFADRRRLRLQP
jgi:HlyD family secretion protein